MLTHLQKNYMLTVSTMTDAYDTVATCDKCHISLTEDWWTCGQCQNYYDSFDLCHTCYSEEFPEGHAHVKEEFLTVHIKGVIFLRIFVVLNCVIYSCFSL